MCHMSLLFFFLQNDRASKWRVCYQRGLPGLVSQRLPHLKYHSIIYLYYDVGIVKNSPNYTGSVKNIFRSLGIYPV